MFFSKEKPAAVWPKVPPSLNHNSFELQDANRSDALATSSIADKPGQITPYLGLRARLSQIWFNRWTVLLILVLVRVLILIAGLNDDIGDAKVKALSACTKVEDIGSAMASMPHYLSVGVNSLAAEGISKAVHGLVAILSMILTGVEGLILFVINFYLGTYICLTAALIHGSLDIGVGAAHAATDVINKGIKSITDNLQNDIKGIQDAINSAFSGINSVGSVFNKDLKPPTIDISGKIKELQNIKVDDKEFVKSLTSLNDSIPTYDEAQNMASDAISIPFNLVKDALNKKYGEYQFPNDIFPVANKEALSFCSGNTRINDFFDSLWGIARTAKITFIVVLLVLAILVCVPMTWLEVKRYRRQQHHAKVLTKHGFDSMDVVYISSRPFTATAGIKIASKFSGRRQILVRWAIAYATSVPALFVLSLAIAGFFSCLCQWILLRVLEKEAPALASQVGDFAGDVVKTLENVSTKWAADANGALLTVQDEINDDLFGHVVNATSAVNNTLNTFTQQVNDGISKVFGGTVLDNVVHNIVRCIIGIKIEAVEKGLTWVHDHAKVTLPMFPNDTFSVGAQKSIGDDSDLTSFLASPSSVTTDEITGAVYRVINYLHNNLIQEALISTGLLLVYIIVVLIGVVRSMAGMVIPDRSGSSEKKFYTGDGRAPLSPRRTQSQSGMRFPTPESEGRNSTVQDEKLATVRGGKGGIKNPPGHYRGSSYGQVEHANRI